MHESLSNTSEKAGMPPGTLVHVGTHHQTDTSITLIDYSKDSLEQLAIQSVEEIIRYRDTNTVTWLNIEGLTNPDLVESLGRMLGIHPLILEDILNTHQRPKFEEHDDYLFIVLKNLSLKNNDFSVDYEQVSMLVLNNFVVTFREDKNDIFVPLKQRLNSSKGRIRNLGADYLAYAIMDTIVDQMFSLLDSLDDIIEVTEEKLLANPGKDLLATVQRLKRELIYLRKSVSPLRELFSAMVRSDNALIQEKTLIYIRDVYDHVLRITESIDSHREMLSGLLDIYMSSVGNRMNEIMQVLTVFASIFIPLTFIAGIYGMNFEYMPELKWQWAYPVLWISFVSIAVTLLVYFKRRKWL